MQLSFLGQAYTPATPAIESIPTHETAIFLGNPYTRKHYTIAPRPQSLELTYRGIRYAR